VLTWIGRRYVGLDGHREPVGIGSNLAVSSEMPCSEWIQKVCNGQRLSISLLLSKLAYVLKCISEDDADDTATITLMTLECGGHVYAKRGARQLARLRMAALA